MILIVLVVVAIAIFGFNYQKKVHAIANDDVISYPFKTGAYCLANAPTIKGQDAQSASALFQWYEQKFDSASNDLTSATYLAVEYQNTVGNPGLTIGIMSQGQRFGTYTDGKPVYFVSEEGVVTQLSVLYGAVSLGTGKGMILLPIDSLSIVSWGDQGATLAGASSFFFETNAQYNWNFEMKIGEVSYTTATDLEHASYTKLLDLSTQVKSDKNYKSDVTVTYPSEAVDTTKATYAFKKGDYALANAPKVIGQAAQTAGAVYQWYEDKFDDAVDLTGATYLAVEAENVVGNPGLTIGIMSQGQRFGTYTDGKPIYFVSEDGSVTNLSVLYSAVNFGEAAKGMIVLPIDSISLVSWGAAGSTLASATSFFFETNAQYNWGFEIKLGEVAYTTAADFMSATYTKLLDLSTSLKKDKIYSADVTVEWPAKATDTTKEPVSFTWPFSEHSLDNAPTYKALTSQADSDSWQWAEVAFGNHDLSGATYLAVDVKMVGNPGLTLGIMGGGTRWGTYVNNENEAFLMDKEGNKVALAGINGGYTNLGLNAEGMLLLPIANLTKVGWDSANGQLSAATSFFVETNGRYNWGFKLTIGEIGYYVGEPDEGAEYHSLIDLSGGMNKASATGAVFEIEWPASSSVGDIKGLSITYPFRSGDDSKFNYAGLWTGTSVSDSTDNWQRLDVAFDVANVDLSAATYFAIQYYAKSGTPGITYGLENNGTRYSIVGSSGEDVYYVNEEGLIEKALTIQYDAVNNGNQYGMLLIPMTLIHRQFGSEGNGLDGIQKLILTTNSRYNWNFEIGVGEVGYYTGQPVDADFTFHKLLDLTITSKDSKYSATSDIAENRSTVARIKIDQKVYGDTQIFYFATNKTAGSLIPWTGGADGHQDMTTDTYGDDALLLVSDGPREGADAYTAFNIADGVHYEFAGSKGITIWARNDSDKELAFNLEIDVLHPETTARGRFNVTQGHRYWLYDLNTHKQTIYMSRPCITLPVGFEGWVRIPFDCFEQAAWSITDANYGAFPRQYFMTEGSYVPYVGLTVYSGDYTGKEFAVNKIGSYGVTPTLITALVPASETKKDILALMGLAE